MIVTHHVGFPFLFFPYALHTLFSTMFGLIDLIFYFFIAGALYSMFRKAGTEYAWLAFIPIAALWPFLWTINRSAWNVLWLLIPVVNTILMLYWTGQLIQCYGTSPWLVLLTLVPILNLIFLGIMLYLGYSSSVQYRGNGPYGKGHVHNFYY